MLTIDSNNWTLLGLWIATMDVTTESTANHFSRFVNSRISFIESVVRNNTEMDLPNHLDPERVPSPGEDEPFVYDSGLLGEIFELGIDRDDTVWRYTTLEKFDQIVEEGNRLRHGGLHFVEIDWMRQHNQYEGTFPTPYLRERVNVQKNVYLDDPSRELTEEEAEQKALEKINRKYSKKRVRTVSEAFSGNLRRFLVT